MKVRVAGSVRKWGASARTKAPRQSEDGVQGQKQEVNLVN